MPLIQLTELEIRSRWLRDIRAEIPSADIVEGSDYFVVAKAIANTCLPIYANGAFSAKQAFPDTADEPGLKKYASVYNVPKLGAVKATGSITVTTSVATTIATGTTLRNPSTGTRYETVGMTTIGVSLTATAYVVANDAGKASDATSGTILDFETTPPSVDPSATVISISGGDDAWNNTRWASEILKRMRARPGSGNVPHILSLCGSVPAVEQAFVYPALRGRGTLDVVIVTSSAATGTTGTSARVAGTDLINKAQGALQYGVRAPGGDFISGIPGDVYANTAVHAAVPQETILRIEYRASKANPFDVWPPFGVGFSVPSNFNTWYRLGLTPTSPFTTIRVTKPISGTVVAPVVDQLVGLFFPDVGYCKSQILGVVDGGAFWTLTVSTWLASDESSPETPAPAGAIVVPWNAMLTRIAGAPLESSAALTGALGDYFAVLGPGEMTSLTATDTQRRIRWPRVSDTNPITGLVEWPTDVNSRLVSAIVRATDVLDLVVYALDSGLAVDDDLKTPAVPVPAFLGTPPSILTLGVPYLIPVR